MQQIREIPVGKIKVGEHDQRLGFDEETLSGLMSSIPRVGLLYPILVKTEGEKFLVLDGHTRLEALKRLGMVLVPCTLAEPDKVAENEIAFAGNFFRKELSAVELASAIKDVIENKTMTIEEIAAGFHRSVNWVNSMLAICIWPDDVLQAMHEGGMSISAAANLALVTDDTYRQFLVNNALDGGVTARTTAAWLQAWRSMQPASEAILTEPVDGRPPPQPATPQAPCFICSNIHLVNEMSHVPMCGPCIQTIRAST